MSISRRTFVKGSLALPVVSAAVSGCGNDVSAAPIVDAEVNDDPSSSNYGKIEIAVPRYPDLDAVGGAVMLRLAELSPGTRPFDVPPLGVLLVHRSTADDAPEFIATRADCPHQGCPLGYNKSAGLIECPCHASRFLATPSATDPTMCVGKVVHLPAQDNLTVYEVKRLGDFIYVNLQVDQSCGTASNLPAVVNGTITVRWRCTVAAERRRHGHRQARRPQRQADDRAHRREHHQLCVRDLHAQEVHDLARARRG